MPVLIVAEHDNAALKSATLHAVTAAAAIGGDIHLLVAGAQCRDTATELATLVARRGRGELFERRHGHIQPLIVEDGSTGDPRVGVLVEPRLPDQLAAVGIQCIHVSGVVP